jgi:DNA-binding PadR family transcriptional regulator
MEVKYMKAQDAVLGLLMQNSMSGYEIKKCFETVFSHFFDASYGSVYPTLKKMEKEGLIQGEVIIQEGKPNKNVYTIMDLGRSSFSSYLKGRVEPDVVRSDVCMKLYFGHYAEDEDVLLWLEQSIQQQERQLQELQAVLEQCASIMSVPQQICVKLGIASHISALEVLKESQKDFEN